MNEILWIISLLLSFVIALLSYKYLGKIGLFIWIVVATIVSNIQTVKIINLFGLETSLGTILYGSTFLATDILNYKYGEKEARKTIVYGFVAMIVMTLFMSISLIYNPSTNDFSQDSLKTIFSLNIRITIASLIAFGISQLIDTWLFSKLQKKYNKLWLSNNASTIFCQLIDTILFTIITYIGTVNFSTLVEIMLSMYLLKFIVAILDTPFMYMASKIKSIAKDEIENGDGKNVR